MIFGLLSGGAPRFLADERGAGTAWGLTAFVLLVGLCGLAVDVTDAFRGRTMLQATADAAALAAVIDLPDTGAATAAALRYAAVNMSGGRHGQVLDADDVVFGAWDADRRRFTPGAPEPDTVAVTLRRAGANGNGWPTNFLRIIGLDAWDIVVLAGAQRFIPDCLLDGLVARGIVDLSSRNAFSPGFCLHGNSGVDMQTQNGFAAGTRVSMPDVPGDLQVPADDLSKNPGLAEALMEDIIDPRMVNHLDEIIQGLLDLDPLVTPDYVDAGKPVIKKGANYGFADLEPGRVYHLQCSPNKTAGIPKGTKLEQVVIVADCKIHAGQGVVMSDVVLASRGGSGGQGGGLGTNITFPSDPLLGAPDDCAPGGGVVILSTGSVHFSSQSTYHGVQMVAAGDIDLGARANGINGIAAQAGGDITMTSNNALGPCTGGAPQLFTSWYYRLVF